MDFIFFLFFFLLKKTIDDCQSSYNENRHFLRFHFYCDILSINVYIYIYIIKQILTIQNEKFTSITNISVTLSNVFLEMVKRVHREYIFNMTTEE